MHSLGLCRLDWGLALTFAMPRFAHIAVHARVGLGLKPSDAGLSWEAFRCC